MPPFWCRRSWWIPTEKKAMRNFEACCHSGRFLSIGAFYFPCGWFNSIRWESCCLIKGPNLFLGINICPIPSHLYRDMSDCSISKAQHPEFSCSEAGFTGSLSAWQFWLHGTRLKHIYVESMKVTICVQVMAAHSDSNTQIYGDKMSWNVLSLVESEGQQSLLFWCQVGKDRQLKLQPEPTSEAELRGVERSCGKNMKDLT